MSSKANSLVGNIFNTDESENQAQQNKTAALQLKTKNVFGTEEDTTKNLFNPFLKKNGELINPNLNYQKMLNSPYIPDKVKTYISQATGLSYPTVKLTSSPKPQSGRKLSSSGNYISGDYISGGDAGGGSVGSADGTIAGEALKYLGTPYVYGGESTGGMDCSGFVYNALKDAGYNVGRTTAQGYRSQGTTVSKNNLQPGDLIYYGSNGNATHVGIYIGNGQMVHSSGGSKNTASNPGKGVTITNVDYRGDFIEAKRL